ncbi:hypothetical protein CesoFtcFv8_010452 [Champsocephalus esox]|uniref:Uncharacterized protein n=1 Tax=Champsocephalus esox TaxID=159716 RepID=A0AAN8C591_9TELE|nr:hypothetical protein CesoFtcFv8_010452 [Champsocephalus esox]
MTSSFRGKAAAFLKSTQQPHSENKSHLKWPPISFNLPLMKAGTFPSDVAPQHGRDLRAKPETRGLWPLWRCGTCGLGRGYGSRVLQRMAEFTKRGEDREGEVTTFHKKYRTL